MGSNPVDALKYFSGLICDCFYCDYHCDNHIIILRLSDRSSIHVVVGHFSFLFQLSQLSFILVLKLELIDGPLLRLKKLFLYYLLT